MNGAKISGLDEGSMAVLQISKIENLACCPLLRQLTITGNKITTRDDVEHLKASSLCFFSTQVES